MNNSGVQKNKCPKALKIFIAILLVIGGMIAYSVVVKPALRVRRTDTAFKELNLPSSFDLISKAVTQTDGDIITRAMTIQTRTYEVSMNMAQAKEVLLKLMREDEDVAVVVATELSSFREYVVEEYPTYEEALEVVVRQQNTNPEGDIYSISFGSPHNDYRSSMHPGRRGVVELQNNCSPGWMALKSGAYMTVVFNDTENDANRVEIDGEGRIVPNWNRFERESCSTEPDKTFVTIVMWAM